MNNFGSGRIISSSYQNADRFIGQSPMEGISANLNSQEVNEESHFILTIPERIKGLMTMIETMLDIILVEDNPVDVELTLDALNENNLVNRVKVLKDGEEAVNYI